MAMVVGPETHRTRRFTAAEAGRTVEVGLLGEDEPYELIDGELRYVSPQDPPHAGAVRRLTAILGQAYGVAYEVGVQLPIGGITDSIPEPDLAVTAARDVNAPHRAPARPSSSSRSPGAASAATSTRLRSWEL